LAGGHVQGHVVESTNIAVDKGSNNIESLNGEFGHCEQFREAREVLSATLTENRYFLSMAISESEIAQVRSATDIVALIGETVALKRTGQRWTGLCPFHGEKTPSFSVNAEEGRYYCFGCRASGDQITWVREIQHLDFIEALRLLADRAGIELHEDVNAGPALKDRKEALAAMERAVEWYHERLLESPEARGARDYLRSRGISGETARQFKLGWAPDEWDALTNSLKLTEKVLLATGLGFVNKRDRRQDALRARIIFPIFDSAGKAVAVGGRILPATIEGPARQDGYVEAKYKNSPETPIYSKRRTLYALNFAKDNIIKSDEIIVCEGYTDVIAFFTAGLPRAVATCGTALGEEHFRIMGRFAKRIVLAYDADSAGQSAAASVYQWERQNEVEVAVARLPKGMDPAELAQSGPESLRKAVAEAVPFLRFRLNRVLEGSNESTAEGRARAAELAMQVLAEHPSELVRDQYIQDLVGRLGIDQNILRARVLELMKNPLPRSEREIANEPAPRRSQPRSPLPRPGLEALRLYVHGPDAMKERLIAPYFVNEVQREIFEALTTKQSLSELIDALDLRGQDEAAQVLSELAVQELDRHYSQSDVTAVVAQLMRSAVIAELKSLDRDMREGRVTPDVAMATSRDVKERVELLETIDGDVAERDLRHWLLERASLTSS
jgi:DNA primase